MKPPNLPGQTAKGTVSSPVMIILKYVVLGVLINIVLTYISTQSYYNVKANDNLIRLIISGLISGVILITYFFVMILVVKEYREKYSGGFISFWKAVFVSFLTAFLIGLIVSLFMLIYLFLINPGFLNEVSGASMSPFSKQDQTSIYLISQLVSFLVGCLVGAVISLIVAAIMRRTPPPNYA